MPISLRYILILSSHLRLGLPKYLFNLSLKNIKYVAYSPQESHAAELDFSNWLADGNTTG